MNKSERETWSLKQDAYLRENPIPAIIGAVAVGVAVGFLVALRETSRHREPVRGFFDDLAEGVRDRMKPLQQKARRAYANSSGRVTDAVHDAMDRARKLDVDPGVWWRRFWS